MDFNHQTTIRTKMGKLFPDNNHATAHGNDSCTRSVRPCQQVRDHIYPCLPMGNKPEPWLNKNGLQRTMVEQKWVAKERCLNETMGNQPLERCPSKVTPRIWTSRMALSGHRNGSQHAEAALVQRIAFECLPTAREVELAVPAAHVSDKARRWTCSRVASIWLRPLHKNKHISSSDKLLLEPARKNTQ